MAHGRQLCCPLYPHQELECKDNNTWEICQEFSKVALGPEDKVSHIRNHSLLLAYFSEAK